MADLRPTAQYQAVEKHLRSCHEPAFGRPSALKEPHVTPDGRRVVVTADVLDDLAGVPRTAIYAAEHGTLRRVSSGNGSARSARFSPEGSRLAFLADRGQAGVFQLHLLDVGGGFGEAVAAPEVPGTVEYLYWSPDGRLVLLGVAGLGAELSGGQGSGRNAGGSAGADGLAGSDGPAGSDGSAGEVSAWLPETDDGETAGNAWRSVWIYGVDQGEVRRVSPVGLNCWEAGWCGPDGIVAITSNAPGEDDWYQAVLSHIDLATGSARTLLTSDVQLALPSGSPDGRRVATTLAHDAPGILDCLGVIQDNDKNVARSRKPRIILGRRSLSE